MPHKAMTRALMVCAAASAIVIGMAGTAHAANKTVSNIYGSITHVDDGDTFRVCDTRADGYGVRGELTDAHNIYGAQEDGGDAGCDTFQYDVKEDHPYRITICWLGPGTADQRCEGAELRE